MLDEAGCAAVYDCSTSQQMPSVDSEVLPKDYSINMCNKPKMASEP